MLFRSVTDRLDRRRLIIAVDSVRTLVLLLLATAVVLDVATIWLVLVAAGVGVLVILVS